MRSLQTVIIPFQESYFLLIFWEKQHWKEQQEVLKQLLQPPLFQSENTEACYLFFDKTILYRYSFSVLQNNLKTPELQTWKKFEQFKLLLRTQVNDQDKIKQIAFLIKILPDVHFVM